MANPTGHEPVRLRLDLDTGEVVEIDGSTVPDRETGEPVPAIVVRMPCWRAHGLAQVLREWSAVGLIMEERRASLDEAPLARVLNMAAVAMGDPVALRWETERAAPVT